MGYGKAGLVVVLGLIGMSAVATEPREVIEETTAYIMYADGSVEQKQRDELPTELRALKQSEASGKSSTGLGKRQSGVQSAPGPHSTARGTLQENAIPGLWKGFGGVPYGCNGVINAIDKGPDGKIYLGGRFTACNDVIANNIVAWDPATNEFEALGSPAGVNNIIEALAFAPNGDLIIGGSGIRRAGSASVNNLARWNGTSWSAVGQDSPNSVIRAIEVDPVSGAIYIAGDFTKFFLAGGGELEVNRIAVWNGTSWSGLADGFDSGVNSIEFVDGILYAGGRFTQSGTLPLTRVAAWDGTQWSDVGGGTNSTVESLTTDGTDLFVGGFFSSAGSIFTGPIARWDGTQWSSIDAPTCCFGDMHYAGGKLYVTGGFAEVDGIPASRVAIWDGASWSATADSSAFSGSGSTIFSDGNDIFIGGPFAVIGTSSPENFPAVGTFANGISRFDAASEQWKPLGNGEGNNLNGIVSDMAAVGDEVWVSGLFNAAGTQFLPSGLARWNGNEWLPVPGDNAPCGNLRSFDVETGGDVFAATSCNFSNGTDWGRTARFDGSAWQPLDQGLVNASIQNVTADPVTGDAYYSGGFSETAGDSPITVNSIARWDGASWNSVGTGSENGISGFVTTAAAYDSTVMVGGFFDQAGTSTVDNLALWDSSVWGLPGDGLKRFGGSSPLVDSLEARGPAVFATGVFANSGAQELRNIAEWNGTAWEPLQGVAGVGIGGRGRVLHVAGDKLYVAGLFTEAGGRPAREIARWDGTDWYSLGTGTENGLGRSDTNLGFTTNAILSTPAGVMVGGEFGGSSAVTSPNLIRFVPMENLDFNLEVQLIESQPTSANEGLRGTDENLARYEITITNNGDFALVDSVLDIDWSPSPLAIEWICQPVPPATRGCSQDSGSGSLDQVLEVPAGGSVLFLVDVTPDLQTSPFLDITANYSAAPAEVATGTVSDAARGSAAVSPEGVFKNDFE